MLQGLELEDKQLVSLGEKLLAVKEHDFVVQFVQELCGRLAESLPQRKNYMALASFAGSLLQKV